MEDYESPNYESHPSFKDARIFYNKDHLSCNVGLFIIKFVLF